MLDLPKLIDCFWHSILCVRALSLSYLSLSLCLSPRCIIYYMSYIIFAVVVWSLYDFTSTVRALSLSPPPPSFGPYFSISLFRFLCLIRSLCLCSSFFAASSLSISLPIARTIVCCSFSSISLNCVVCSTFFLFWINTYGLEREKQKKWEYSQTRESERERANQVLCCGSLDVISSLEIVVH